jgi:hypothetical protein
LNGHHVVVVYGGSGRVAISVLDLVANFQANVRDQQELAEMLLMVLTYEPRQGYAVDPSAVVTRSEKPK